ncbi:MAG TPA: glycosyltransferase [Candidatus Binataceae bacterium]
MSRLERLRVATRHTPSLSAASKSTATSPRQQPDPGGHWPVDVSRPQTRTLLLMMYSNPSYYPPTINAVSLLSEHFRIHLLSRNVAGPPHSWPEAVRVETVGSYATPEEKTAAPALSKFTEYVRFVSRGRRLVAELKPHIIYAFDAHAFAAAVRARARDSQVPIVFHCHDLPELEKPPLTSLQTWIVKSALRNTRAASCVVFPEKYRAAYWLGKAGDARPAVIVPNGASIGFYPGRSDWRELAQRRFAEKKICYVGSIGGDNGHREAVCALEHLDDAFQLDLIGFVPDDFGRELNMLARARAVEPRLSLDGWPSRDQRIRRMERAAVGLLLYQPVSKNWEYSGSAPNKLFEYAALGLPVVVPDRASYREFLGNERWVSFADVKDPASIANSIANILADRDAYVAMSRAAREAFESRYNYERLFQPVLDRIFELTRTVTPKLAPGARPGDVAIGV